MGDVGAVAEFLRRMTDFFVNEDQLPEIRRRRQLKAKREEARRALLDNRFDDLDRHIRELRDLAEKP